MLNKIHFKDPSFIIQEPNSVSQVIPVQSINLPFNLLTGQGKVVVCSVTLIFIFILLGILFHQIIDFIDAIKYPLILKGRAMWITLWLIRNF